MSIQVGIKDKLDTNLVVIVTGAASGIGKAQSLAFLNSGAFVIAIDKNTNTLEHKNSLVIQADISKVDEVERIYGIVSTRFKKIDVLCNSAGILDEFKNIEDTTIELWDGVIGCNLRSMFLITKQFMPLLLVSQASRIINMASIAGLTTAGGGIAYTVSKHAVVGFTKQLAYEYQGKGIRINAVAPGAVKTKMTESDFEKDAILAKWVQDETPVKRWAVAEEVAKLTLFLASDAADYIHGSIFTIDGGWTIKG